MSELVPVQFVRSWGPYVAHDLAAFTREDAAQLVARRFAVPVVSRHITVETAMVEPPERAVTRRMQS
jgi:hypothetical protein